MMIRSKAPLRLGFAGGGTDVSPFSDQHGGCVLNATIDQFAYCTLEPSSDGEVSIVALDRGESWSAPAPGRIALDEPLRLHKGIYNRIVQQFNSGKPLPVRISTHADVVAGSGLGTSSTLVVAVLQAFNEWLHLGLGEYDIAQLAYQIEREDVGLAGGKQDQYAAAFGGFNFMEFGGDSRVIVNPLRVKDWIVSELEVSLVLFHTGTSRDSAAIIDEQVAQASRAGSPSIDVLDSLKRDAVDMKEHLLTGDLRGFASVLGKSWQAKKRLAHSITNAHIEAIFTLALASGAQTGKVSGAGGGGVIMFVVDPRERPRLIEALGALEGRVIPFHFTQKGAEAWCPDPARRPPPGGVRGEWTR
jgi:D-glycero-alpha-D-manno-heptose-7-phosphate kinase